VPDLQTRFFDFVVDQKRYDDRLRDPGFGDGDRLLAGRLAAFRFFGPFPFEFFDSHIRDIAARVVFVGNVHAQFHPRDVIGTYGRIQGAPDLTN
jgi:hypothetical protein